METWFLNHVLGLCLSVLLLNLPGPLDAGTPSNNSTDPSTAGFYYSSTTDELSNITGSSATSTSSSSESLSPSQRNLLLTHTAAETQTATARNFDTEQTKTFTETSNRSLETTSLSTEPLASTLVVATTEASSSRDWKDFIDKDHVPKSSQEEVNTRLLQDSPSTTLHLGDASSFTSQTTDLSDSTYASTTISRAGERTLRSVTSSSNSSTSSAFTEDFNSKQPPSISEGGDGGHNVQSEHYTHSAPSTMAGSSQTTNQQITHSFDGMSSETGRPELSQGTQSLTQPPNATQHQHTSTSEEPSDSTPPLRVTEPSTEQSEVSFSSTPPITSPAGGATDISQTNQELDSNVRTSPESSTAGHSSSTQNQDGTEGLSSQTREENVSLGLTTVPPTVSISTSEMNHSTNMPEVTKVFLTTTPVTVTERSQITEEDTPSTTTTTTTVTPLPAASSPRFSSTTSSSTPESHTEATMPNTTPSTTASTVALQASTVHSTHIMPPSQTQGPSTRTANPTDVTTLQTETSTGTLGVITSHSHYISTSYTHSPPASSTEAVHTTLKQTDRGTTEQVVTTSPTEIQTPKAPPLPTNPCVPNPCMNGGMCLSYDGSGFTCKCQQAWTGPTCTNDTDECEKNPCPADSKCVNTRGSFSCECPLGYDLEDGRTCTKAKTFLGTFKFSMKNHENSANMHEIQRDIMQLLNVSLSGFQGYRRSTLSKKDEDGVHILAVNMFSISANVTSTEVYKSINRSLSSHSLFPHGSLIYQVESLCAATNTQCDKDRSSCTDDNGTTYCRCREGYYKQSPNDLSCQECGDGYKLENGTCVLCMFGFGGFNCGNFYKLIAVVVSAAGGALLLILIIALVVTCCKKDKNDINKIIFKSGDLQMSPYADFPKNNRISMEWGRETIEMQENGSTKNLLQMTDIYYSPALRNSDLDRNGLYPFTGLPGSRHSCIYPAQWNPSFISDDSRRRDYF